MSESSPAVEALLVAITELGPVEMSAREIAAEIDWTRPPLDRWASDSHISGVRMALDRMAKADEAEELDDETFTVQAPQRVDPVEFRARRLALGLGQETLGRYIGVKQVSVSRWERKDRPVTQRAVRALEELESDRDDLVRSMVKAVAEGAQRADEGVRVEIQLYPTDGDFWEACPRLAGVPVEIQWVAAALARAKLVERGIDVPIVPAR